MVELAKYMEIYQGAPDAVSRGKQALVKVFADDIKTQWAKSDTAYNTYYFKRVVALAIIFKTTDEIIKQTAWYKEKHSYKANVIAYTMSVLFDYIRKKSEEKTAKEERKVEAEVDSLKYIMASGREYWERVLEWGTSRRLLSEMETSILKLVINMNVTGRIPSVKQAKVVLKTRERLISEGMPMQFS